MQKYIGWVTDTKGNAIGNASVRVNTSAGALATIYSDNGVTPRTNPITSESDGSYAFYADDGRYNIVVTKTGYTFDADDTADVILYDGPAVSGGAATGNFITPEQYGAVGDGVADDTTAFQAALDSGAPGVFAQNIYKITTGLELADYQVLFGLPLTMYPNPSPGANYPRIIFNPGAINKVCIKNAAGTVGNGVQDLHIIMNDATHTAIQFSQSYGNIAKRITFRGTMNIGLLSDRTYVCAYHDLSFEGCSMKTAGIYMDQSNAMSIERFTSSVSPADAGICLYGITCDNGHQIAIKECTFQGQTIGIATNSGTILIENMYNEETLVNCRFGNIAGGTPSQQGQITMIGGIFGQANSGHSQYASRGPLIIAGMSTLHMTNPSFLNTANNAVSGVWPILLYGAGPVTVVNGFHFNATSPKLEKLFIQKNGGTTQPWTVIGEQYGNHSGTRIMLKDTGAYGSNAHAISVDNNGKIGTVSGADVLTAGAAYTPLTAGGAVDGLLDNDLVTGASLVL